MSTFNLHDALLYDQLEDERVQCNLCAHRCTISEGGKGICRVRENHGGRLYTRVFGNLIAQNVDPIEKKPLYHFYPGSTAYSIATPGCNFHCEWCQNWQISQMPRLMNLPDRKRVQPDAIVEAANATGSQSIAYTYTEPTIFFEYSFAVSQLAHAAGLKNVYVTNGFMTPEMIDLYHPWLDAANVDIKAFKDETYHRLMGGRLEPVLESCRRLKAAGVWLEVTTLIVPGVNDDPDELRDLAQFIYDDLGPETPWHLSRFYPQYKMTSQPPTSEKILMNTKAMGEEIGLDYIYIGNVAGVYGTRCKKCGQDLLIRMGYQTRIVGLDNVGCCTECGTSVDGVGMRG